MNTGLAIPAGSCGKRLYSQAPFTLHRKNFENGSFSLKTRQMVSVHKAPEEFKNTRIPDQFGFVFESKGNHLHGYSDACLSRKASFSHENKIQALSNCYGLRSVFETFRFRDVYGLRNKAAFSNSLATHLRALFWTLMIQQ